MNISFNVLRQTMDFTRDLVRQAQFGDTPCVLLKLDAETEEPVELGRLETGWLIGFDRKRQTAVLQVWNAEIASKNWLRQATHIRILPEDASVSPTVYEIERGTLHAPPGKLLTWTADVTQRDNLQSR